MEKLLRSLLVFLVLVFWPYVLFSQSSVTAPTIEEQLKQERASNSLLRQQLTQATQLLKNFEEASGTSAQTSPMLIKLYRKLKTQLAKTQSDYDSSLKKVGDLEKALSDMHSSHAQYVGVTDDQISHYKSEADLYKGTVYIMIGGVAIVVTLAVIVVIIEKVTGKPVF